MSRDIDKSDGSESVRDYEVLEDDPGQTEVLGVPPTSRYLTAFSIDELHPECQHLAETDNKIVLRKHLDVLLSPLQICLASAVIEECIEQLNMLIGRCPRANSAFDFKDVNERFHKFQYPCKKVVIIQEKEDLNWRKKIAEDVGLLQKGLRIAKSDLLYDEHSILQCYLKLELWKWRNESNLKYWHKKLSKTLHTMKETSELLRTAAKCAKKQSNMSSFQTQEQYEDSLIKFGTAIEYINKYNASRQEQNRLFIREEENKQIEEAESKHNEQENETTVHDCIVKYYKKTLESLESEIVHWRKKYTADMEQMEFKTYALLTETSRQAANMAEILAVYYLREMQLEHYMEKKEDLFYLETSEYAMDILYTTVQAWWKGTMVRWELVPQEGEKKKKKPQKAKK